MNITSQEAMQLLRDIETGAVTLTPLDDWWEVFAGNVRYTTSNGWTIIVFNDCNDWDYVDTLTAPDGRSAEYEDLPRDVQAYRPATLEIEQRYTGAHP